MTLVELLGVAFALGCDAFSVAVGVGGCWRDARSRFRLSFHFGLFQFLMPLIGWKLGQQIIPLIRGWDHWFVFAVLMIIAGKMLYESFKAERDDEARRTWNPTRGWMLVGLSVAVSIDALGVGLTFGALERNQVAYVIIIGLTAIVMTAVGMLVGSTASSKLGTWAERAGPVVLVLVAVKMLLG